MVADCISVQVILTKLFVFSAHALHLEDSCFFSSRARHTRCSRDWSSDVCSSDLRGRGGRRRPSKGWASLTPTELDVVRLAREGLGNKEIGRASCRERV